MMITKSQLESKQVSEVKVHPTLQITIIIIIIY